MTGRILITFLAAFGAATSAAAGDVNDANVTRPDNRDVSAPPAPDHGRDLAPAASAPGNQTNDAGVRTRDNANLRGESAAGASRGRDTTPSASAPAGANDANVDRNNANVNAPR